MHVALWGRAGRQQKNEAYDVDVSTAGTRQHEKESAVSFASTQAPSNRTSNRARRPLSIPLWLRGTLLCCMQSGCSTSSHQLSDPPDTEQIRGDAFILLESTRRDSKAEIPAVSLYTPIDDEFTWPAEADAIEFLMVEFCIARSGKVDDVRVLHGLTQLAPPATASVRRWRFKPRVVDGARRRTCKHALIAYDVQGALDIRTYFDVAYTREQNRSVIAPYWAPVSPPGPGLLTAPQARHPLERPPADGAEGPWFHAYNVELKFCIDENGTTRKVGVQNPVVPPFSGPVLADSWDWVFTPTTANGKPVTICGLEELFRVVVRPRRDMFDRALFRALPSGSGLI